MYVVLYIRAGALQTITNDLVVVGDHSVAGTQLRFQGQAVNLTQAGADEYQTKLRELAKYGFVEIAG